MENTYRLNNDNSEIKIKVKVGTIGNASTIVSEKGAVGEILKSKPGDNGDINKKKLGISDKLINTTIIADLAILLDGVPKNQLDQAFENLFVRVTLFGGPDGEQSFDIGPAEKLQFNDKRLIVAAKEIKMTS